MTPPTPPILRSERSERLEGWAASSPLAVLRDGASRLLRTREEPARRVGKNRVAIHRRVGNRANAIFAHAATTVHARLPTLRRHRHCERSEAIARRARLRRRLRLLAMTPPTDLILRSERSERREGWAASSPRRPS